MEIKNRLLLPLCLWILFFLIAVALWLARDNIFYLFNFVYIGTCVAVGVFLHLSKVNYARNAVQFFVGIYMLFYLGVISNENMQIEGFWYYLFLGVFQAAVLHYVVAKIVGPLLYGRSWCGYACWTAMILDLLPNKAPLKPRKKIGYIRYIVFITSIIFTAALLLLRVSNIERIMFWSFIIGNTVYYSVGVALAHVLKDNRAFCKYVCPITVFLKPASYYSVLRVKNNEKECISCNKCKHVCPMDVDVTDNSRNRTNGTECILCFQCIDACPQKSLHL